MARRGELNLGGTANGGTAGSFAAVQRKENPTHLGGTATNLAEYGFTGPVRAPNAQLDEFSDHIDVSEVYDTPGGRTLLIGHDTYGYEAAEVKHAGVKFPLVEGGRGADLGSKLTWVKRAAIAADAVEDRFSHGAGLEVIDVDLTTPKLSSRGADFVVKVGNDDYDLTFTHDYGKKTTSLEACNYEKGPTHLTNAEKSMLFTMVTGRASTKNLQDDLTGLFSELAEDIAADPDADDHLKSSLAAVK